MFEAITPAKASQMAEDLVAMGALASPSIDAQINYYWKNAEALDKRGDQYKAEGRMDMAQVCYSRAFKSASKAFNLAVQRKIDERF